MNYLFPFFRFLSPFISHLYTSDHVKLSLPSVNFQGNLVMHMRFIKPLNSNFVWMRKFTTHHSQTQYYINTHFFLIFLTHTQAFHSERIWLTYDDNGTKKQWGTRILSLYWIPLMEFLFPLQRGNYDNVVFAEIITRVRFIRRIRYCRVVPFFFLYGKNLLRAYNRTDL